MIIPKQDWECQRASLCLARPRCAKWMDAGDTRDMCSRLQVPPQSRHFHLQPGELTSFLPHPVVRRPSCHLRFTRGFEEAPEGAKNQGSRTQRFIVRKHMRVCRIWQVLSSPGLRRMAPHLERGRVVLSKPTSG